MSRIRTIKPDFFKHEELYELELETKLPIRLAFIGIWTVCDREGRFKWRPNQIKIDVIPYDKCDFSRVLDALATRGFIEEYESDTGERYGFVPTFGSHQVINNRESQSQLPSPFDASSTRDPRGLRMHKGKGKEGKGKEGKGRSDERVSDATRLGADLELSGEWEAFCRQERQDLDPEQTFARFKDYWIAKPGKDGRKTDWFATWRNWVRNQKSNTKTLIDFKEQRAQRAVDEFVFGSTPGRIIDVN